MAIFIASTKSISRSNGQSAVASASYRAGVELDDKRYGKTHDYSKRSGVMSADIILPTALASAYTDISRSDLWNKAEAAEKRKDARVAREWLVNLPHELSAEDRKAIAHQFAQTLADRYSTIADCAIHQPTQREIDRGADPRNFHAHILFTTRTAKLDDNNEIVLTDKATIELSDNKRRSLGMERVNVEIKEVRQLWEQIANEKLAEYDHELIDSRSYSDQGKDIEPQLKMGSVATKIERDAYETAKAAAEEKGEVFNGIAPVTTRGKINLMINERNRLVRTRELADLREKQLFIVPEVPTPEYKPSNVSNDELEQAESVVERIKQVRIQRQIAKEAAEVLEKRRIAQHQRAIADEKERERLLAQKEARQAKREQRRAQIAKEEADFKTQHDHISHQDLSDQHRLLKIIDQKSDFGQHLSTLLHLDQQMSAWQRYRSEPSTTDHQKQLAGREQYEIGSHIIGH
ncbi:MobA/MobL family protein, partial [Psychrobacter celer]|uniref:MobA/MobL family protein n=1 Tax=Psychrobacter celer TaxID=306572 RepID=UPI002FE4838B